MAMNKYHRFPSVKVRGFIVNYTDNLNYDIWFDFESITEDDLIIKESSGESSGSSFSSSSSFSSDTRRNAESIGSHIANRYYMVHKEPYTYTDVQIENGQLIDTVRYNDIFGIISSGVIKNGSSYRCRLKKIDNVKSANSILEEVENLVYYNDGWVICEISDVDIYNRLLVEIYDINMTYSINKVLLNNYSQFFKYYPVNNKFYPRESFGKDRSFNFSNSKKYSNRPPGNYGNQTDSKGFSWK